MTMRTTVLQILQSWRQALQLFSQEQRHIFILIILKSWLTGIFTISKVLLHPWMICCVLLSALSIINPFYLTGLIAFTVTFLIAAIRPSVALKNNYYFDQFMIIAIYAWIGMLLWQALPLFILDSFSFFSNQIIASTVIYDVCFSFFAYALSPLFIIWLLFLCDTLLSYDPLFFLKSLSQAVKMFVFNYPFYFVIYYVFWIMLSLLCWLSQSLLYTQELGVLFLTFLLTVPLYICLLTNFYIKRLHEQCNLYCQVILK